MLGGSREPNMLFHSSLTFESCFPCFLAMKKDQNNLKEASMTNPCLYYSLRAWGRGRGIARTHELFVLHEGRFIYIHRETC